MNGIPSQHTLPTPYNVGSVHCYTLEQDNDIILFDAGPPTNEAKEYFRKHVDLGRLRHVLVTHSHIDHYGLAHWLERETEATIYLPFRDCLKVARHQERLERTYEYLKGIGFSDVYLNSLKEVMSSEAIFPQLPEKYLVAEDEVPGNLGIDVLACPGHSQSDLVYVGDNWAVTGDTLLRNIFQSPLLEIDLETGSRFCSYSAYCTSIVRLASLQYKTILPGHRHDIDSVDATLVAYISRLLQRVERILPYAQEPRVAGIMEKVFGWTVTRPFHVYLKVSELLFMLDFLKMPEKLAGALEKIGLFEDVAEQFERVTARQTARGAEDGSIALGHR